ncbi:hypothetical protein H696_03506 [Fonticula alba]|uniref:Amino acid transporter transmembrane domain-containing protein n=1 Tax=Fonticula alba TaxID=691883 RepID=A0A058Z962_FONAL|nr:hypothetical protein H696_03506 [Fonticula alba]KCV70042.1 hypothetical protein H696_03506 [Fonticula alba]|eukprot:XP_009495648.1 hypothetical protein H696_03506 [Fonticula alba]
MPFAFASAGIGLSLVILTLVTIISYVTMVWLIEVLARIECLHAIGAITAEGAPADTVDLEASRSLIINPHDSGLNVVPGDRMQTSTSPPSGTMTPSPESLIASARRFMQITDRKFELNEVTGFFLGKAWQRFFEVAMCLYLFGALWGFASVFGTTFGETIPFIGLSSKTWPCSFYGDPANLPSECMASYQLYVVIFALLVVPLSLKDMSEQTFIQIALCIVRFASFFVMVLWCLSFLFVEPYDPSIPDPGSPPYIAPGLSWFNMGGFGIAFSTCVFAQLTHHSAPGLAQPTKDKSKLAVVFLAALVVTFFFYAILGTTVALYFGPSTQPMVSLNWQFIGGTPAGHSYPWWEYPLRYFILFFPVAVAISAYPLTAITFANTVYAALPAGWTKQQTCPRWRLGTRLFATLPPIACGLIMFELSTIVQFTGLFGVFIAFLFPALLQWRSRRAVRSALGLTDGSSDDMLKTPYTMPYISSDIATYLVGLFGFGSLGLMIALIISPDLFG